MPVMTTVRGGRGVALGIALAALGGCGEGDIDGARGDVPAFGTAAPGAPTPTGLNTQPVGGELPAARPNDLFQDGQASTGCDPSLAGQLGDMPLRRLTQTQYENTLIDLFANFGVALPPDIGDDVPGDDLAGAFPSNDHVTVSEGHVRAYETVAETVAELATAPQSLPRLVTECNPGTGDAACADAFIRRFAATAFRRPVDETVVAGLMGVFQAGAPRGFASGISLVVQAVLQSPELLYHVEQKLPGSGQALWLDPSEIASRMSYFLWNSLPDDELVRAAAAGELVDPARLRAQAERLLADPRGERSVRVFTHYWLSLGQASVQILDQATYPEWTGSAFNQAAIDETHAFMQHVLRGGGAGSLAELFTASYGFPGPELAAVYGSPVSDGVTPVELPPGQRAGLLTQPGFLLAHSDPDFKTTAIKRGATVVNNFLCYEIRFPDNIEIDLNIAAPGPGASARDILESHTQDPVCQTCHAAINPVGFTFDRYDAIGKLRDADPFGNPLRDDAVLTVADPAVDGPTMGVVELGQKLANSDNAKSCMVRQMYRYALSRNETDADTCTLVGVAQQFAASGFNVRQLMLDIVTSDGFTKRPNI